GEGLAILAGDALLTDAFQVLVSDDLLDDRIKVALIDQLSQAAGSWGMVAGQVGDIEAEQTPVDYQGLKQIHDQKTGAL
ncbi:polyprenyl synthetase family protein, partial [Klebsiella pneumoniae]|nr:polyprenyl synthetase family protein [Klebsiella pneumoniae]